jgi:hypothetical protein
VDVPNADPPRHPAVHELNRSLILGPSDLGEADWTTGIVRANASLERWRAWFKDPTADRELFLTLYHEAQHVLQIASCTKLYKTALLLYGLVLNVHEKFPDAADYPDKLEGNFDSELLGMVRTAIWDLNWRGDWDLSLLEIVEGVTHLTERRLIGNYDTVSYLDYIPNAFVGPTYTIAFERFFKLTGHNERAIIYFTPACHYALCSETPQQSLFAIGEAVRTGRLGAEAGPPQIRAICQQEDPGFRGWSWEWVGASKELAHPMYQRVLALMHGHSKPGGLFDRYIIRPDKVDDFFLSALGQPTILNPKGDTLAPGYSEWTILVSHWEGTPDEKAKAREVRRITKLATIARKYVAEFGNPPPNVKRVLR